MSASRTQTTTTTTSLTAGPSRSHAAPPPSADYVEDEEDLEEDKDEIIRRAQEKVRRMKERKAAAEEEAAKKAAEEARRQKEVAARKFGVPTAAGGRDQDREGKRQGQGPACWSKKISYQMQAGKRSSVICKPCHDAKVRCSYSGQPSTVKQEGGGKPTGEQLAVLESQMAQLLADNQQFREGQVKADTYHCHFNWKLDWLMMDAARRRTLPPEMPKAGPSHLPKKRRRVMDSKEEEEDQGRVEEEIGEEKKEEDGEEEEERDELVPKRARSEKGKERAE
ncbi:hypothetical protein F5877DRAFT_84347 [Lentinula edodes]|nr:hypothetical protein F5877DRAFT_84347 [Lentinula edodes]